MSKTGNEIKPGDVVVIRRGTWSSRVGSVLADLGGGFYRVRVIIPHAEEVMPRESLAFLSRSSKEA